MAENQFEFTDRYRACGIPYPEPDTVCLGQCEGMGCVPINQYETDPTFSALWREAHAKAHTFRGRLKAIRDCDFLRWHRRVAILWERCDGWHFVKCPECGGTGKRSAGRARQETDRANE